MKLKIFLACMAILCCIPNYPLSQSGENAHGIVLPDQTSQTKINTLLGSYFTQNVGQIPDPRIFFHSTNAYFTSEGVTYRVIDNSKREETQSRNRNEADSPEVTSHPMQIFNMHFVGANSAVPIPGEELAQRSNFFIGNNSETWKTDIPNYLELTYANLYDGIDLVYHALPDGMKYEFVVHPGGDVKDIAIQYDGVDISTNGKSIFIKTSFGVLLDGELVAYTDDGGCHTPVDARIVVRDNEVSYDVEYDPTQTLILDPLMHSTFIGGSSYDDAGNILLNSTSGVYAIGSSYSTDFPTTSGAYDRSSNGDQDIVVFEMDSNLSKLIFSTYIGGSDIDSGYDVKMDSDGNLVLAGGSSSTDFPTTTNAYDRICNAYDAVVMKLSPNGNKLLYSTYLGGSKSDYAGRLLLDGSDNIYILGTTYSTDFPVTSGAFASSLKGGMDVYISELSSSGDKLLASTYMGGSSDEYVHGMDNDSSGDLIIVGVTFSYNFPTTADAYCTYSHGGYDGYVFKISKDLSELKYSTYMGGSYIDEMQDVKTDSSDNAYVFGYTYSTDFPVTDGAFCTTLNSGGCTLLELDPTGSQLIFSTLVGGNNDDRAGSLALDEEGNIYLAGFTDSKDFPLKGAEYSSIVPGGGYTTFGAKMNSNGSALLYSTFLGGQYDTPTSVALNGDFYLAGMTWDSQFPTTADAYDRTLDGYDIFISELKLPTVPDAPRNLTARLGDGTTDLSWQQPTFDGYRNVTNFTIYRGLGASSLESLTNVSNVTDFMDTGLMNGQTYYYSVAAINVMGRGNQSATVNVTPGAVPTPPQKLKARMGSCFVNLSWNPPADAKGFPVSNYSVYRSDSSGPWHLQATVGNVTSYNDTDTNNGIYYRYAVSAWNAIGEGNQSNIVNSTPGKSPSPPTNLTTDIGNSAVTLMWDPPEDNGGYEIKSYKIYITEDDQEHFLAEVTGTSYTQIGLENGKTYYYAISAVNSLGESDKTDKIEVTPGVRPGAPIVSAQGLNGQVHLSWTIDDDGGIPVIYFNIFKRDTQNTEMSFLFESYETAYDDLTVINGNTYFYSVSAVNPKGEGNRSEEISVVPNGDGRAPGIPSNFSLAAGNANVSLSWNVPSDTGGLKDLDYPVYRGTNANDLVLIAIASGLGFNDTTVLNGATYSYAVSSRNIKGESKRSNILTATPVGNGRLPLAPLNLSAVKQGESIQLSWEAPSDTGGLQINGYNIYRKNDDLESSLIGHATNPGYLDSSFQDGITYYYSITALNNLGEGPNGTMVNMTIYNVPFMVQDLKAETGNKFVNLSWHAPASDGGSIIIGYNIYRGTQIQVITFMKGSTGSSLNDTGLSNGVTYYYRISAKNDLGEGPLSEIFNATPGTVPDKPRDLTVRLVGGKAVLGWEPPSDAGGFPILEYRIYRGDSEGNIQFVASSKSRGYTDGNLTHGKRYYFRITSINEKGEGPASATVSVMNPAQASMNSNPSTLTIVAILSMVSIISVIIITVWWKKGSTRRKTIQ